MGGARGGGREREGREGRGNNYSTLGQKTDCAMLQSRQINDENDTIKSGEAKKLTREIYTTSILQRTTMNNGRSYGTMSSIG